MNWSISDIAEARRIAASLLEALALENYAYTLEPSNGSWEIRVEYSGPAGWQVKTLRIDNRVLRDSREKDSPAHRRLVDEWRDELLGTGAAWGTSSVEDW